MSREILLDAQELMNLDWAILYNTSNLIEGTHTLQSFVNGAASDMLKHHQTMAIDVQSFTGEAPLIHI